MELTCIHYKSMRSAMFGFTGVGKSHILALLMNELPPPVRISTAISMTPVRAITLTRIDMGGLTFTRITEDTYTMKILKTGQEYVARTSITGNLAGILGGFWNFFYKPTEPTDEVGRELILKLHQLRTDEESFEGKTLCELTDCGGQPQFLEVLPRFIENINLGILVTNLSQSLDEHPVTHYFNQDGKPVGDGVKYPLTNEQVLRLCMRMIASKSQDGKPIKFVIVGTHRDLEGMCVHLNEDGDCTHKHGECIQPRPEKNQRLKNMVESFGLEDSVIYKSADELIFAFNAKDPQEVDRQLAEQMRAQMLSVSTNNISIPVSYYAVELILKKNVHQTGYIAFLESDILKEAAGYNFTQESFKEALRYLHRLRRIFYFENEFPGKVIGERQVVLNKHTELVAYHIELSTSPLYREMPLDGMWRKFRDYGVLTINCLRKFPAHYVTGVFSPVDMMKLFEKLLIVSEVSFRDVRASSSPPTAEDREYLMPSVLQVDPQASCNPTPQTWSVPPLVLYFPGGSVRYGVFCGTICYVMTRNKWRLFRHPESRRLYHIARNSVHFSIPGYRGKVTINDPFDSFFFVTVHIPQDVPFETVSCLCMKVRDTLITAITNVTKNLRYTADTPQVAFPCEEHKASHNILHPATVSEMCDELLCIKYDGIRKQMLTPEHRAWLKGEQ
jgi:hypothetical protein